MGQLENILRTIVAEKNFHLDEKMDAIGATIENFHIKKNREIKNNLIEKINELEDFDKSNVRILITQYLK